MTARCDGSSSACDEMIKNTQSAEQVQACGKHSTLTPPVRSSPFPGPGVYVWGAITHQVPWLPLSAFCVLWPLLCHTAAVSAASLCSDWIRQESERRRWRGRDGEAAGMRWEAGLIWDGTRFYRGHYTWLDGHFPCCGPYLTVPAHHTTTCMVGNQ